MQVYSFCLRATNRSMISPARSTEGGSELQPPRLKSGGFCDSAAPRPFRLVRTIAHGSAVLDVLKKHVTQPKATRRRRKIAASTATGFAFGVRALLRRLPPKLLKIFFRLRLGLVHAKNEKTRSRFVKEKRRLPNKTKVGPRGQLSRKFRESWPLHTGSCGHVRRRCLHFYLCPATTFQSWRR